MGCGASKEPARPAPMARKEATNYGHMIKLVNQYDAAKGYLDACNHNATNTGGLASRPRQTRTSSGTWQ